MKKRPSRLLLGAPCLLIVREFDTPPPVYLGPSIYSVGVGFLKSILRIFLNFLVFSPSLVLAIFEPLG